MFLVTKLFTLSKVTQIEFAGSHFILLVNIWPAQVMMDLGDYGMLPLAKTLVRTSQTGSYCFRKGIPKRFTPCSFKMTAHWWHLGKFSL
jgi:hypothetical protein